MVHSQVVCFVSGDIMLKKSLLILLLSDIHLTVLSIFYYLMLVNATDTPLETGISFLSVYFLISVAGTTFLLISEKYSGGLPSILLSGLYQLVIPAICLLCAYLLETPDYHNQNYLTSLYFFFTKLFSIRLISLFAVPVLNILIRLMLQIKAHE